MGAWVEATVARLLVLRSAAVFAGAFVLLVGVTPANAGILRFVATTGTDTVHNNCILPFFPCLTIANALDKADPGDGIFVLNGTYDERLVIDKDITIVGQSRANTRLAAGAEERGRMVLVRKGVTVAISHLTISGGKLPTITTSGGGAGIRNEGTLTLDDTAITDNGVFGASASGGGILNHGTLTVSSSTVSGNSATISGGISNSGRLTIQSSAISSNSSAGIGGIGNSGHLTIQDSHIEDNIGGGIVNGLAGASATIARSTIARNRTTSFGGGIVNQEGTITLDEVTISDNTSLEEGGGLYNVGKAVLRDVAFTNNMAGDKTHANDGGGLVNIGIPPFPTMILNRVTFDGNIAWGRAGALKNVNAWATLTNVTLRVNSSVSHVGSGIYNDGGTRLHNVTSVSDESAGGAIYSVSGVVLMKNSIIVGSGSCLDWAGGTIQSLGHNLGDSSCPLDAARHDQINVQPELGGFGNQGGFVKTFPLLKGSPAIDRGTNNGCPAIDANLVSRPQDGDLDGTATCDIGAYEFRAHIGDTD